MFQLKGIKKDYIVGENIVNALKGIDLCFRDFEFISILGPSGCGKTTLLNIIGGLDSYTEGDLLIDGVSTKDFKNRHWDNYRNHNVGFIFQNYNLINHQSVFSNVELALVLSGVSKEERKSKVLDALKMVGLEKEIEKLPNQLSGGQQQRVAIARAIVNNPKIILADEPTGALDSETSIQVMEILKELSKDRLVIMVTHNPELALRYSTRIIKLNDGLVINDSNKYLPSKEELEELEKVHQEKIKEYKDLKTRRLLFIKERKLKMSFKTAFLLSIKNLFSKKTRTLLTATAGSIGIIGIALISAISSGATTYISSKEEESLSSYPLQIETSSIDYNRFLNIILNKNTPLETIDENKVLINQSLSSLLNEYSSSSFSNDLASLKEFIESDNLQSKKIKEGANAISYLYKYKLNIYSENDNKITNVSSSSLYQEILNKINGGNIDKTIMQLLMSQVSTFGSFLPSKEDKLFNEELIYNQYELVASSLGSRWPSSINECVVVLDKNNMLNDYAYYALGMGNKEDLFKVIEGIDVNQVDTLDYQELLNLNYKVILPTSHYVKDKEITVEDGHKIQLYKDVLKEDLNSQEVLKDLYDNSNIPLKVVGIIRPKKNVSSPCINSTVAYSPKLISYCNELIKESDVYKEQTKQENLSYSIFNGRKLLDSNVDKKVLIDEYLLSLSEEKRNSLEQEEKIYTLKFMKDQFSSVFSIVDNLNANLTINMIKNEVKTPISRNEFLDYFSLDYDDFYHKFINDKIFDHIEFLAESENETLFYEVVDISSIFEEYSSLGYENFYMNEMGDYFDTFDSIMDKLNVVDEDIPFRIYIYAKDFKSKDMIVSSLEAYNQLYPLRKITYNDFVGMVMSSVSTIINSITYVLIGLISISLIVSSIMIGIITYISVLERTKEIGILRSLGASNKDIFTLFNAETITLGFCSGSIGVLFTALLSIPLNIILVNFTGIPGFAKLEVITGIMLIFISMLLSFISGLIPSQMASKKDPVIALRSE